MIFDWLQSGQGAALIGGGVVGLAAALLLVLTGRAMNLSGMLGSLLGGNEGLAATSIAVLAGIVLAPTIWLVWAPLPEAGGAEATCRWSFWPACLQALARASVVSA